MCDSYVIIEQPDNTAIYVVVLTKDGTGTFWNDLSKEIVRLDQPNSKVYFDYLFRNGLKNRIFTSHTDENCHCSLSIEPITDDTNFDIAVFNRFYQENSEYIQNSHLTSIQKHIFLNILTVSKLRLTNKLKRSSCDL